MLLTGVTFLSNEFCCVIIVFPFTSLCAVNLSAVNHCGWLAAVFSR